MQNHTWKMFDMTSLTCRQRFPGQTDYSPVVPGRRLSTPTDAPAVLQYRPTVIVIYRLLSSALVQQRCQ